MSTSMGHALKRAGVDTSAASLHQLAVELLRNNDMRPRSALPQFVKRVREEGGLMCALHDKCETENTGIEYLQRVAKDMRGETVSRQKRDEAGKSITAMDGNRPCSRFDNSAQADGKARSYAPEEAIKHFPSATLDDGDGNNHIAVDGKQNGASPSSSEYRLKAKWPLPQKANQGSPQSGASKRTLANMEQIRKVTTVFDTYKLSDGTLIGDLRYSQIDRVFTHSARDAAILWIVRNYGVPSDHNMRIRDYVRADALGDDHIAKIERAIQRAAEESEHAE